MDGRVRREVSARGRSAVLSAALPRLGLFPGGKAYSFGRAAGPDRGRPLRRGEPIPAQQTGTYGPARRETAHQDDVPMPASAV